MNFQSSLYYRCTSTLHTFQLSPQITSMLLHVYQFASQPPETQKSVHARKHNIKVKIYLHPATRHTAVEARSIFVPVHRSLVPRHAFQHILQIHWYGLEVSGPCIPIKWETLGHHRSGCPACKSQEKPLTEGWFTQVA